VPFDQPALVPTGEAEAPDAVGGFHAGMMISLAQKENAQALSRWALEPSRENPSDGGGFVQKGYRPAPSSA